MLVMTRNVSNIKITKKFKAKTMIEEEKKQRKKSSLSSVESCEIITTIFYRILVNYGMFLKV